MNYYLKTMTTAVLAGVLSLAHAQQVNDSNTPLHLMKPAYRLGYGISKPEEVKQVMDRVLSYIATVTPAVLEDKSTGKAVTDMKRIDEQTQLHRGDFRLTSYEWGVTYSAVLAAYEATGDEAYRQYAYERYQLLADAFPYFMKMHQQGKKIDELMRKVVEPHALDDAGAICSSMIKATLVDPQLKHVRPLIDNYAQFILKKEYRLSDGTLARIRPQNNTVWLDDMFMGIPTIVQMGRLTGDASYYDEAVKQVRQFAQRMFVEEKGLFRHGWVEQMTTHPAFHWGRANGWAILTLCEVLDALPNDYAGRDEVLVLLQKHIAGLARLQSKDGFWHQLLDHPDTYEETSATAIYTYCIAHAANCGWIDPLAYGPVAQLGWHAVESAVNDKGEVEGVCVGTGMAFDPAFYAYRPTHRMAAHGYGPVIWAGAEMLRLLRQQHPKMNDSAVQFYPYEIKTDKPIFNVDGSTKF